MAAFELPPNLHPDCGQIAWMLGTWQGNGHGDYPDIEAFQFGQELSFSQDGRPFFHYMSRSWVIDEEGEKVRDGAIETGFLRAVGDDRFEMVLAHHSGVIEAWYGTAENGKVELATDAIGRTATARQVTGGHRLYGNVEGDLLYAYDMAAEEHELQPHLWARLQRR